MKIFIILYVITTFVISGPIPGDQWSVTQIQQQFSDTIQDSCTAHRCFENIARNVGEYNYQTKQMITSVVLKDTMQ